MISNAYILCSKCLITIVMFIFAVYFLIKYEMCLCRYSSYIVKENERRSTLGLEQDESQIELKDNKELMELGMTASTDTSDSA